MKKSYICGTSDIPLRGITIGEVFDETVERFPENEALVVRHQNIRWTYKRLKEEVDLCARSLVSLGLKKGDRLGVWSPNCAEWTVVQIATAKIGVILVNINPSYRLHELEYALQKSGCSAIIISDQSKYLNYTEMVYELLPELKNSLPGEFSSDKLPELNSVIRIHEIPCQGMFSWNQMLDLVGNVSQEELEDIQNELSFDDPINIQYTSGTTGFPKAATLSHHNIVNNAFFTAHIMNFSEKERLVIPVPLYHCFGMVVGNMACITHGATMIYPAEGFDAEAVLQAVEEEKATALHGVPTMFITELDHPNFTNYDLSTLRTGIMAGAPCPVEVMKKVKKLMHMSEIQIAYGMTETSPVTTQTTIGTTLEKQVGTVGQIHPHQEIKVIDPETGRTVPIGEPGELCMRGYCVMIGYWNDLEKTAEAIDQNRWIHSGDLATIDEEGYVKIVGRIKDMIIRGGENIYPREIEEFLFTHPDILDVKVIGVPDEKYDEEVMAWIILKTKGTTAEDIREFCKGKIAHYKIPRYYKFTDEFPMTVTGKVRKVEMREISIEELHLEKAAAIDKA